MEDEKLDDASSKKADSSAALRNDNRMDEQPQKQKQMRGFFATLRMTTFEGLVYWSRRTLSVEEEFSVAHDLFFALGVA
jgi:hypothetical protein